MKNNFNISRFGKYFLYDLRQLWRNNGKAVILIGLIGVIMYFTYLLTALIFTRQWKYPGIEVRTVMFFVSSVILVLYTARTYGHLTDKKSGSTWLMIPASRIEKFVSLLISTLICIPVAFVGVYFASDAILTAIDPNMSKTICGTVVSGAIDLAKLMSGSLEEIYISPFQFYLACTLSLMGSILYFVLCGIIFKKWKIAGAIGIIFLLQVLFTNIIGLIFQFTDIAAWIDTWEVADAQGLVDRFFVYGNLINLLQLVLLGWLIYLRIKTLKH